MNCSRMHTWMAALALVGACSGTIAAGAQRPAKVQTIPGAKGQVTAGNPRPNTGAANKGNGKTTPRPDHVAGNRAGGKRDGNTHDQTIADRIAANPRQRAHIEAMLPAGMTLEQASS